MRGVDIIMLCERFAAAGVRNRRLFDTAAEKIESKLERITGKARRSIDDNDSNSKNQIALLKNALARLRGGTFGLMDDRALALLWRHSARQQKSGRQVESNSGNHVVHQNDGNHKEIERLRDPITFLDPLLPLVIDLGCGYGTSLLGLCEVQRRATMNGKNNGRDDGDANRIIFNFLGVDMSRESIRYARSVSHRWFPDDGVVAGCCRFLEADCESALDWVLREYPGPVHWVLCQFPSPYRLRDMFKMKVDPCIDRTSGDANGALLESQEKKSLFRLY